MKNYTAICDNNSAVTAYFLSRTMQDEKAFTQAIKETMAYLNSARPDLIVYFRYVWYSDLIKSIKKACKAFPNTEEFDVAAEVALKKIEVYIPLFGFSVTSHVMDELGYNIDRLNYLNLLRSHK